MKILLWVDQEDVVEDETENRVFTYETAIQKIWNGRVSLICEEDSGYLGPFLSGNPAELREVYTWLRAAISEEPDRHETKPNLRCVDFGDLTEHEKEYGFFWADDDSFDVEDDPDDGPMPNL